MPALEARLADFHAAHPQPVGVSVDSHFSHGAWAESLGGISFPLLADFHPKGAVADSFGLYLADKGLTDRATVLIDAGGVIRHISSVTPSGKRDMQAVLTMCQEHDAGYDGAMEVAADKPGLPDGSVLYVKSSCMFSRWALSARTNLHLEGALPVKNVSDDEAARAELLERGGKNQAPALYSDGELMYESADIAAHLVERCAVL